MKEIKVVWQSKATHYCELDPCYKKHYWDNCGDLTGGLKNRW